MRTRRSIAVIVRETGDDADVVGCGPGPLWLLVRRPEDDEDLPGVWGLPAGTAEPGETDLDLVRRIGVEKLGVELDPGARVAVGSVERADYTLEMELWTAAIVAGRPDPDTPRSGNASGRTRYADWRWEDPSALEPGARDGSLCCRLGLGVAGR